MHLDTLFHSNIWAIEKNASSFLLEHAKLSFDGSKISHAAESKAVDIAATSGAIYQASHTKGALIIPVRGILFQPKNGS